jgi:hypothetical protein
VVGPIVVDLLRHPSIRAALEAVEVSRYDLLFAYVHGRAPLRAELDRREGLVDVVFHDDSYTTMPFVIEILTECFRARRGHGEDEDGSQSTRTAARSWRRCVATVRRRAWYVLRAPRRDSEDAAPHRSLDSEAGFTLA